MPRQSLQLGVGIYLRQCPRCLLGWWDWSTEGNFDPQSFYDEAYFQSAETRKGYDDYHALETALRLTGRARLRRIDAVLTAGTRADRDNGVRLSKARRLLDIGCGTGCFLREAERAGWDVAGIEVSEYAAEQARGRGLTVECKPIEELHLTPTEYDCVTLWDTIEHVRDPVETLRQAARALRPGGVLALSTGDITSLCARLSGPRWHLFTLPEHLFFFSPDALRRLLSKADCRVTRITREVNWVPASYLLERLRKSILRRHERPRRSAAWLQRGAIPATLFDVLGVYAVRAERS